MNIYGLWTLSSSGVWDARFDGTYLYRPYKHADERQQHLTCEHLDVIQKPAHVTNGAQLRNDSRVIMSRIARKQASCRIQQCFTGSVRKAVCE